MCAKVGVDPLASNKGFWAELLGIGDFYYELGWYPKSSLFLTILIGAFFFYFQISYLLFVAKNGTKLRALLLLFLVYLQNCLTLQAFF